MVTYKYYLYTLSRGCVCCTILPCVTSIFLGFHFTNHLFQFLFLSFKKNSLMLIDTCNIILNASQTKIGTKRLVTRLSHLHTMILFYI